LILLVGPWLPFWTENGWLHATPWLSTLADARATRLLVSLAGALTMLAGLGELGAFLLRRDRRSREAEADGRFQ
jgi:hypothetical protein